MCHLHCNFAWSGTSLVDVNSQRIVEFDHLGDGRIESEVFKIVGNAMDCFMQFTLQRKWCCIVADVQFTSVFVDPLRGLRDEAVRTQIDALTNPIAAKLNTLGEVRNQIDAEKTKSATLQATLDGLKSGIMESAPAVKPKMTKAELQALMDKHGVVTLPAATCPLCGVAPTRHGSVLLCPTHGSAPFEVALNTTSTLGVDSVGTGAPTLPDRK